jgi:hypothetical protein
MSMIIGFVSDSSEPWCWTQCHAMTGSWPAIKVDGVLVYFGYPQARENDAERAVRAGVEAVTEIEALDSNVRM